MKGASIILRRLVGARWPYIAARSSLGSDGLLLSSAAAAISYSTLVLADEPAPLSVSTIPPTFANSQSPHSVNHFRNFSSPPPSGSSNIVSIESEEQFNDSVRKVEDESLPAIFYFTAAWCGPCRLLSPIIGQLSQKYPHVTTYKVDIDKEGLGNALSKLNIHSVPTMHFYRNGKKASEVIGADVQRLKDTMEALYK